MSVADSVLSVATVLTGIGGPLTGLWIARGKRGVDDATENRIKEEIRSMEDERDRRRTKRLLRLEKYVDADIPFHRDVVAFINELHRTGGVPEGVRIPVAPELPPLDEDEPTGPR